MAFDTGTLTARDLVLDNPIERVVLTPTMSLAEAGEVPFEGRRKGTLGILFRDGKIDLNDLLWQMKHAEQPKARDAGRVLLIHHLGDADVVRATQRYGPHVYGQSKHLEEKQYDNLLDAVLYAFIAALITLGVFNWLITGAVSALTKGYPWVSVFAVVALLLVPFIALGWWFKLRVQNRISEFKNYRSGREGEEAVLEVLRANLDNRWSVFRSLVLSGRDKAKGGDTDIILVGPSGVWVLEVKSHKSTLRVSDGRWQYQTGKHWRPLRPDPSMQAKGNAASVNDHLKRHGIAKQWVEPVVVLTQPQPVTNFADPSTAIWLQYDMTSKIRDLNSGVTVTGTPLDDASCKRVTSILRELVPKSANT
ncbi:MAG TPA: nuclease-related domain-containing protein [Chloroflexia bacterium]|nr:nuclease-related domain-containing protein [Chloroflexia bacterium]